MHRQLIKKMAKSTNKTEQKKQKVEKMGIFFERSGHSPMAARVFALLLLSEPPYRDFYSIQEFLCASKSAVSNALNHLMREGMVDYITFSGDRKRYFRVNPKGWLEVMQEKIRQAATFRHLIEDVLNERTDTKYLEFNEELKKVIGFLSFLSKEMENINARWEAMQEEK